MSETTPLIPGLIAGTAETDVGFQSILDYIREHSRTEYRKGELFERVMKEYFQADPIYKKRFTNVWLWKEWAELRDDFDGVDTGIDLVAQEREGGYCAIQCKCYAPTTRIQKRHVDSFISASARDPFTTRIFVNTGADLGINTRKTIKGLKPACQVRSFFDLASQPINWPDLAQQLPEQLEYQQETFYLRTHQREALNDVINGFKDSDRGKMIMACGTGKTFTALRIAEEIAGSGGRVLYLVPSIGLFAQAMREWGEQQELQHRYIGICSDTSTGKSAEDTPIEELEIPVTTELDVITEALQTTDEDAMTVVFCTYHSLHRIESAQGDGAPAFDLVLCDEAHRTTGIESPDDDTSPFVLVHHAERIHANKRLYMTATPRLYTESTKRKAAKHDTEIFSMDDPEKYGPEFHHLPFSKAIQLGLLSDYKVAIFTVNEPETDAALQGYLSSGGTEINITDATKIVGSWRALQNPEGKPDDDETIQPLTRVIAFNDRIKNSERLVEHWNGVIAHAIEEMPEDQRPVDFQCETQHVDGQHNAFERKTRIEWLKGSTAGACRILSNARCLSEGIDVPALDAVLFMTPRNSHVDIVQAVGRVMRKAEGKEYGYIILPVAIPPGTDPSTALDNNKIFANIWSVLRALRSHDDRLDAEINRLDLNKSPSDHIIFPTLGPEPDSETLPIPFDFATIPPHAIYAKIVEKCGDRKYWESWAKDVANIFKRLVVRIENLLDNPDNELLRDWFDAFHAELQTSINPSVTRADAIDMMAQHILTHPVFEALFENYDFASGNPVSIALDKLRADFEEFGLKDETEDLEGFYASVKMRAQGIDNSKGRKHVLLELYEKFFKTATKKDADRLGIVYTPDEIVNFILYSADEVLQKEFDRSLSDEGVHVLDPFAGAGIFLARLLQSDLIQGSDLERKYREELHANEIVLLAYYIAAVNIEEAYRGKRGEDSDYTPFNGIILTDTFNLNTPTQASQQTIATSDFLPANSERAEHQQKLPIQVIVGNPPWSAGQKSAADDNPNVDYPLLEDRIEETYAASSSATLKRYLYDSYKLAIRWASDRIEEQGVVAFVTNGSWIDGNGDAGIRACLRTEFNSIYVLNLRGDQRTQGEVSRREGGKVFGSGSRQPVSIVILVKNPNTTHSGCRILYRDIGDYLSREKKLEELKEKKAISGFTDWQAITPDEHHDWIRQRNPAFSKFYPMVSEKAKKGTFADAIFGLHSLGLATGRDSYIYNFSHYHCADNAQRMTQDYLAALSAIEEDPELTVAEAARLHSSNLKWSPELKEKKLERKIQTKFEERYVRKVMYRPFIPTNCYTDDTFIMRKAQMDKIFPDSSSENRLICVPGKGSKNFFSALMIDIMPDLNLTEAGAQCFPRYQYRVPTDPSDTTSTLRGITEAPNRIDNISDTALRTFRERYDDSITKDMIFDYVYGILHAPNYRETFANNLSKEMPRIPFAPGFHAFAEAGKKLAALHLGYETCQQYPLEVIFAHDGDPQPCHYQLTKKAMRLVDDGATLVINSHVSLSIIPEEAHRYMVNGRTPLEWFIDRYKVKQDSASGIVNDPNGWFENPRDLVTAIERIVYVSVESTRIIEALPSPLADSPEE